MFTKKTIIALTLAAVALVFAAPVSAVADAAAAAETVAGPKAHKADNTTGRAAVDSIGYYGRPEVVLFA